MTAGPLTQLSDLIKHDEFTAYTQQLTEVKSRLINSGVMVRQPELDAFLTTSLGGASFNIPSFYDIGNDAARISTDSIPAEYTGGTDNPDPLKLQTAQEVAVGCRRNQSWAYSRLAADISRSDPMEAISSRLADYWAREQERNFVAIIKGICADNDASPSGTDTHTQYDLRYDASSLNSSTFLDGTTNFTLKNLELAKLTMGDSADNLGLMFVHSVVASRLSILDANGFVTIPESETSPEIKLYRGLQVITTDQMPASSGVYETWLFGRGSVAMGIAPEEMGNEAIITNEEAGNGGGAVTLLSRRKWCIHPIGHAYSGTSPAGGPSDLATTNNFANAGSWSRVYPERKQIKFARLITREA